MGQRDRLVHRSRKNGAPGSVVSVLGGGAAGRNVRQATPFTGTTTTPHLYRFYNDRNHRRHPPIYDYRSQDAVPKAFYRVTDPNSSSAKSLPLDRIALWAPGIAMTFIRFLADWWTSRPPSWHRGQKARQSTRRRPYRHPVLSKNYEDQKDLIDRARQFLQDARQAPLPTSAMGLTRWQVCDTIQARRERVDEAIRLFEEGTSVRNVGAQAAQPLGEQLDRGKKWLENRCYDVEAHREIKTPRVMEALSDVQRSLEKSLKTNLSATGSDVRTKRKAGGTNHGFQRAAEAEPGFAVQRTSASATGESDEELEHVDLKALSEEPEQQNKSGVDIRDDREAEEVESQAGSK
ncbi:hypothetical protein FS837_007729 [Tulasnella sp. UAMH 9824]|nr:hypothetical protein FS837_007729 [Tulasnella sp. UAMH 9824]